MVNQIFETYWEEIHSICPRLSEKEAIEAGDALFQIAKLLLTAVQEEPELEKFLTAQMKGDFINEQE